jgi:hypothetical protein
VKVCSLSDDSWFTDILSKQNLACDLRSLCGIYARRKLNRTFLDPFMTSAVFKCFHLCTEICGNGHLGNSWLYLRAEFPINKYRISELGNYITQFQKFLSFASNFQCINMFCNICSYVYNLHRMCRLQAQDRTL